MGMKLCVFQGTFDPIHNAHIKMAEYACKNFDFDKILFIPAYDPPHKESVLTPAKDRFRMVELATKYNPKFEVSDIEYRRKGKSYTYLTIKELYQKYSVDGKINFIIGTDAFDDIDSWYEADKLKPLLKFIVFKRTNEKYTCNGNAEYEIAEMDFTDISSTDIRKKLIDKKNADKEICKEVKEYIKKNELYKN